LALGKSCKVLATFSPKDRLERGGELDINDNVVGSPLFLAISQLPVTIFELLFRLGNASRMSIGGARERQSVHY
jgi:hypothetical protein